MSVEYVLKETIQFKTKKVNLPIFFQKIIKRFTFGTVRQAQKKILRENEQQKCIHKSERLYVEISAEKINALLAQRSICAADIRCLDTNSKQCLKQLCLNTCLYTPQRCKPASQLLGNLNLAEPILQIEKYD